jgi:hypothetical protein
LYAVDVWTPREITYVPANRRTIIERSAVPSPEIDAELFPIVPPGFDSDSESSAPTPQPFPEGPALTAPGA